MRGNTLGLGLPYVGRWFIMKTNTNALSLGSFPHVVIDSGNHDEAKRFHI